MKWEEVRKLYPNQYVLLEELEMHILIVDTGASKSFVSIDDIGNYFTNNDEIVYMYGVGGTDDAFRKCIDKVKLGNCSLRNFNMNLC